VKSIDDTDVTLAWNVTEWLAERLRSITDKQSKDGYVLLDASHEWISPFHEFDRDEMIQREFVVIRLPSDMVYDRWTRALGKGWLQRICLKTAHQAAICNKQRGWI
jgi:hypothetical protein